MGKIFDKICTRDNFDNAIKRLKQNKGSKTPGTDGKNIEYILNNSDITYEEIRHLLKYKYVPKTVKRTYIVQNNKRRPLGIPTIRDRVIQQMFKQILEPIAEKKFHPNSYGFRPNRSTEQAIAHQSNLINRAKLYYCVDVDIKGFFDNINHKKLIKQVWAIGIKDKKVISIIKSMLKANILHQDGTIEKPTKGTPQGGILSPLLANICLNEFDWWIHNQWAGKKTRTKYTHQRTKEEYLRKASNLKEVKIVRYADDFKLMCRTMEEAKTYFSLTKIFLKDKLKLDISPEKSRVVNLRRSYSVFLGFTVRAKRKICTHTEYVARVWICKKAKKRIHRKLKDTIKDIRNSSGKDVIKNVINYNAKVRGIQNYYCLATRCSEDLSHIGLHLNRMKYNIWGRADNYKDIRYKRFYKGFNSKTWSIGGITLFNIQNIRFKKPKMKRKSEKLTKIKTLENNSEYLYNRLRYSDNPEWDKIRAIIYHERKGKCEITNEFMKHNEFDVHHIIPREFGGDDIKDNLIIIKSEIHKELHRKKPNDYVHKYKKFDKYRKILLELIK
ncbi:group II intron reverse transcriptase/maturase [uncultured Ilyobacter sp.]|uniref:group II intron reverse transcriptase/maturase n=1 Tax=uncultured Ilyobacter sp. TaxID=544433 RepID=UPI0029F4B2F2|nr:group II intron reverse transcriptase/maturase [uncultured Ilyobacter sp.]